MKKILTLILCAAMMFSLAAPVLAEQPLYSFREDTLCISGLPGSNVSVDVNGTDVTDFQTSTAQEENTPILYYCIVDPSSSFSDAQRQQQQEALIGLNQSLRDCDRMVLAMMDPDKLNVGPMLETQEARQKAIEESWTLSRRTRLFEDVLAAIQDLTTNEQYNGYLPCVVLITDGINEGTDCKVEATEAVRKSGIRFHSIAVVCYQPTTYALFHAGNALALASQGAVAQNPLVDNVAPAELGKQIAQNMMSLAAIELDTALLDRSAAQQTITLSVPLEEGTWETSLEIPSSQLPEPPVPETTEVTVPETTEPEIADSVLEETTIPETTEPEIHWDSAAQEEEDNMDSRLVAGILVVVLVVSAVAVFFIFQMRREKRLVYEMLDPDRRSRHSKDAETDIDAQKSTPVLMPKAAAAIGEQEPMQDPAQNEALSEEFDLMAWAATLGVLPSDSEDSPELTELNFLTDSAAEEEAAPIIAVSAAPEKSVQEMPKISPLPDIAKTSIPTDPLPMPGCRLKLIPTVDANWTTEYFLPVNESKSFGRSHHADFLLNETDYGLSGIHFEMLWDGRALFIRDSGSTNGTALNSVPLMPEKWVRVKKNPVLLAGAYEYKIEIEK